MSSKTKKILVVCSLPIVVVAILLYLSSAQRVVASDSSLRASIREMNRVNLGGIEVFRLVYAENGLIVAYNSIYVVVIEQNDNGRWEVTHLLNPVPFQHFRLQGSTISVVAVDSTGNFIAIYSFGDDIEDDALYIFDLSKSEFTTHEHGAFPDEMNFSSPENRTKGLITNRSPPQLVEEGYGYYNVRSNTITFFDSDENPVKEIELRYTPSHSPFLYNENTIVYMSPNAFGSLGANLGGYRLCFQNIETGAVTRLRIR